MPWTRLRPKRTGEPETLRRHSTVDPPSEQTYGNAASVDMNHLSPDSTDNSKAPSPLRNSFEPPDGDHVSLSASRSQTRAPEERGSKGHRFSMLQYRHKSDPQISKTAREQANASTPPVPATPAIITTAPTDILDAVQKKKSTFTLPRRHKPAGTSHTLESKSSLIDKTSTQNIHSTSAAASASQSRTTLDEPDKSLHGLAAPPPYGDDSGSTLALPPSRLSESSRSEGSLGDHGLYATTTTTHTVSTTTTFFRLPRRKKNKGPLFPLPVKIPLAEPAHNTSLSARGSIGAHPSDSPSRFSPSKPPTLTTTQRPDNPSHDDPPLPPEVSNGSSPVLTDTSYFGRRGRTSTKGSLRPSIDGDSLPTPPLPHSGRTSISTTGRASLGGLFNMSRLRQNSEPHQFRPSISQPPLPGTPMSAGSKSQSFNLSREPIVVPEREAGDTPAKYLIRLEEAVSRGVVATILSQSNDDFFKNVLRSYMRGFKFFGDPLDMATRKLLMEVELPKETQQIDRVLQAFANRYHECNPGTYSSPDEAYFIAFSILILHTDVFNKNNKHKMQKHDYCKNARGQGVADEILECFYDNVSYTPFIHVDDDLDINGERIVARKSRKKIFSKPSTDSAGKPSREPVDPYTLILDNRLDSLRPSLKDVMDLDDHYNYLGTAPKLNLANLHKTFFKSGILQIVSSRSRPEAFTSPETLANPAEAHPGVVDIKVTKVGIIWRKDTKKKKARSPWQEWGAILTGAQLYFFRDTAWVKSLMHQHHSHHKHGYAGSPVTFKPALQQFKPDVLMSTEDAVALVDESYKKHKNALVFVRHGGFEEVFLAENEAEMNDWLAKLNYAAAFRTAGVRMRGMLGEVADGEKPRAARRINSHGSAHSEQQAVAGAPMSSPTPDAVLARQIQAARQQIMTRKIAEADAKLEESNAHLEVQVRNARHLQILAPVQNRTREQIVLAAGYMSAKIKWMRMEQWRTRCHRDILAMDLKEDIKLVGDVHLQDDRIPSSVLAAVTPGIQEVTKGEVDEGSPPTPRATPRSDTTVRPATHPSPTKGFNLDDVFSTIQASPAAGSHKPKGSWELPPLSFQPTRTSLKSAHSLASVPLARLPLAPQPSSRSVSDGAQSSDQFVSAAKVDSLPSKGDSVELETSQTSDRAEPGSPAVNKMARPETPSGSKERPTDQGKATEPDSNEGRSRVRRSLHRTLRDPHRDSHPPTHHRSKRGKDSASSGGLAEDSGSTVDSEGLARGTGSFTVHGKKASVITFGSEWQNMTPEERVKLRKHTDDSKLSVPSAVDDESSSIRSNFNPTGRPRPISSISASTTTTRSGPVEEAAET